MRRTAYVGDFLRLARETAAGTYLCGTNVTLKEADGAGNWVREFPEAGFQHAWMALRLPNGDTLMSAGSATPVPPQKTASSFLVEVDASGKAVRRFGAADQVPARVRPNFYAMFQVLPNGDVVAAELAEATAPATITPACRSWNSIPPARSCGNGATAASCPRFRASL